MTTTHLLAQAWGMLLVLASLGFLLNKDIVKDMKALVKDRTLIIFSGFVAMVMGVFTILLTPPFAWNWEGTVSLIGWIAVFKGFMRIAMPEVLQDIAKPLLKDKGLVSFFLVLAMAVGFYLIYVGLGAA